MDAEALKALQAPLKASTARRHKRRVVTLRAEGASARASPARWRPARRWSRPGCTPPPAATASWPARATCCCRRWWPAPASRSRAVATALGVDVRDGAVRAEGDLDFRGTLGVDKEAPVGFRAIRLRFELDTDADRGADGHAAAS